MRQPFLTISLLLGVLLLGACQKDQPVPMEAAREPIAAANNLVMALRQNDLVSYQRLSLPPDLNEIAHEQWRISMQATQEPSAEQISDFDYWLHRFTEANAEENLMADIEPRLVALEAEMQGRWPLIVSMAGGFMMTAIAANSGLSDDEKTHISAIVNVLTEWAKTDAGFADRGKARRSVRALSRSVRALDIRHISDIQALELTPALEKAGVLMAGLKEIADIYGLDVNEALDSIVFSNPVRPASALPDSQEVVLTVSYQLKGEQFQFPFRMIAREGRWYPADDVLALEAERAEMLAATSELTPGTPSEQGTEQANEQ